MGEGMEEVRGPGGPWTVAGDSEGEVLMVSVRGLVLAIGGWIQMDRWKMKEK